jgi:hypothetical protein
MRAIPSISVVTVNFFTPLVSCGPVISTATPESGLFAWRIFTAKLLRVSIPLSKHPVIEQAEAGAATSATKQTNRRPAAGRLKGASFSSGEGLRFLPTKAVRKRKSGRGSRSPNIGLYREMIAERL